MLSIAAAVVLSVVASAQAWIQPQGGPDKSMYRAVLQVDAGHGTAGEWTTGARYRVAGPWVLGADVAWNQPNGEDWGRAERGVLEYAFGNHLHGVYLGTDLGVRHQNGRRAVEHHLQAGARLGVRRVYHPGFVAGVSLGPRWSMPLVNADTRPADVMVMAQLGYAPTLNPPSAGYRRDRNGWTPEGKAIVIGLGVAGGTFTALLIGALSSYAGPAAYAG